MFEAGDASAVTISLQIATAIEEQFGFRPRVVTLSGETLAGMIRANPYPEGADDPKNLHFFFLSAPATGADLNALEALASPTERFSLAEAVLYLYAPDGVARSKLFAHVERYLG